MTTRKIISKATLRAAVIALSALAGSAAAAQGAASKPEPATIRVLGLGLAEVKPELARIFVSVSTQAETVPQASAANRETSEKVLARLQALAIPGSDIKTIDMEIFRSYSVSKSVLSSTTAQTFRAEHRIQIILRDTANVGKIVGDLIAIDNMTLQSIVWDVNKREEADDRARAAAVADARHRAEIYAQAASVKLGRLVMIRDEARSAEPMPYRAMAADTPKGSSAMPVVPPETLTFTATAQMVWEIAP